MKLLVSAALLHFRVTNTVSNNGTHPHTTRVDQSTGVQRSLLHGGVARSERTVFPEPFRPAPALTALILLVLLVSVLGGPRGSKPGFPRRVFCISLQGRCCLALVLRDWL